MRFNGNGTNSSLNGNNAFVELVQDDNQIPGGLLHGLLEAQKHRRGCFVSYLADRHCSLCIYLCMHTQKWSLPLQRIRHRSCIGVLLKTFYESID